MFSRKKSQLVLCHMPYGEDCIMTIIYVHIMSTLWTVTVHLDYDYYLYLQNMNNLYLKCQIHK